MAKPLLLTKGGKTFGPLGKEKQVDVCVAPFTAELTKTGVTVVASEPHWWSPKVHHGCAFPFDGSRFERIESGRSAGKAAVGAIAGTLLAGPIGLLAGAAIGATKKHVVAVQHEDATVLLELDNAELQLLAGRGLLSAN
jgi:hypothetical protein